MALIVAPGETFVACVQVEPSIVGSNKITATLKDNAGGTIESKDTTRLGDSMLYCADFTAPQTEGKYYVDFKLVDQNGNMVMELPDELVIVSTKSIEGKLDEIQNELKNVIEPKLDALKTIVEDIQKWVKIRKC